MPALSFTRRRVRRKLTTRVARARIRMRRLYFGQSQAALRFQMAVLGVDLVIIAFFVAQPVLRDTSAYIYLDYAVAAILIADLGARAFAVRRPLRYFAQPVMLIDIVILVTLLFPHTLANIGFLRIMRLWSISQTGTLWRPLRRSGEAEWQDTGRALVNLVTFLFLATGFVFTFFFRGSSGFSGYLDALYFTVASVTTTGYGDVTLDGPWGKLTSIVVMIIGIALFARLAQALFKPRKVTYECPDCGLARHDPDAVHCKACGRMLKIRDEGD